MIFFYYSSDETGYTTQITLGHKWEHNKVQNALGLRPRTSETVSDVRKAGESLRWFSVSRWWGYRSFETYADRSTQSNSFYQHPSLQHPSLLLLSLAGWMTLFTLTSASSLFSCTSTCTFTSSSTLLSRLRSFKENGTNAKRDWGFSLKIDFLT